MKVINSIEPKWKFSVSIRPDLVQEIDKISMVNGLSRNSIIEAILHTALNDPKFKIEVKK